MFILTLDEIGIISACVGEELQAGKVVTFKTRRRRYVVQRGGGGRAWNACIPDRPGPGPSPSNIYSLSAARIIRNFLMQAIFQDKVSVFLRLLLQV